MMLLRRRQEEECLVNQRKMAGKQTTETVSLSLDESVITPTEGAVFFNCFRLYSVKESDFHFIFSTTDNFLLSFQDFFVNSKDFLRDLLSLLPRDYFFVREEMKPEKHDPYLISQKVDTVFFITNQTFIRSVIHLEVKLKMSHVKEFQSKLFLQET